MTEKEKLDKIARARSYIRRKLDQGVKKILKSKRRRIPYSKFVELHDSLNLKCLSTDDK